MPDHEVVEGEMATADGENSDPRPIDRIVGERRDLDPVDQKAQGRTVRLDAEAIGTIRADRL
jgi:hypothetical protein